MWQMKRALKIGSKRPEQLNKKLEGGSAKEQNLPKKKNTKGIIKKYKMYATIKMNIFYFKSANKKCFKIIYMKIIVVDVHIIEQRKMSKAEVSTAWRRA